MKHTPCARANALGGCHKKTTITWHYRSGDAGSDAGETLSCSSGEKEVAADWKEPEAFR
jgi:hypothetical protein